MEILPQKEESKKTNKRVRFELPEEADDVPPSEPKRRKSPEGISKKKYRIKKSILRKLCPLAGQKKPGSVDRHCLDKEGDQNLLKKPDRHSLSAGDESGSSELMQESVDLTDHEVLDKNENCTVRTDHCKPMKRSSFVLRKSKSVGMRTKQADGRYRKKRRVVISKKPRLKVNVLTKHKRYRKRKCEDFGYSTVKKSKKRKVSGGKLKVGKKGHIAKDKRHCRTNSCKVRAKHNAPKVKHNRTNNTSSKVKIIQNKVKKATDKLRKAKLSKQRLQKARYNERMKKATRKKLELKRSTAKKRKENKRKYTLKKQKVASKQNVKKGPQRLRKIRIIKMERELDVVEPLRISLLKYLTFEEAYKKKFDCCYKYCWDDWEEIDMADIIDDHD